jgi:hypothetical protein
MDLVEHARVHLASKTNALHRRTRVSGGSGLRRFCERDDLALLFVASFPSPPLAVCGAIVLPFAATAALKYLPRRGIPPDVAFRWQAAHCVMCNGRLI